MALRDLLVRPGLVIPARCLTVRFARGGGPGGQHVNKVETKVDLRLDLELAEPFLGPDATARIAARLATRLDAAGCVQVISTEHRDQHRNLEAAQARLEALLRTAIAVPKLRRKTRPTRGSQQRRLDDKTRRGEIKRNRREPE